jgi:IS605 OrfB family transposase
MDITRIVTILLPDDPDLRATLVAFQRVQQALSEPCYHDGQPLGALALHRAMYRQVTGTLNSQMTCSAIRQTAAAYASAQANRHAIARPFGFHKARALFLVGQRGRDADFRADGTLSIWTIAGRKQLPFRIPDAFKATLAAAKQIASLTVIERNRRLLGRVTLTLEAPEPQGIHPVGIDLNETNALVAVDPAGTTLFISGKAVKVANKRNYRTRKRLQRARTFAQTVGKQLVEWAPAHAVLVFEALKVPQPRNGTVGGKAIRRRLAVWQRQLIRKAATTTAQEQGMLVAEVHPAYTSQQCSRCGLLGKRHRHAFTCPSCGHAQHADINAAVNIRNRYTILRDGGPPVSRPRSPDASALRASPQLVLWGH